MSEDARLKGLTEKAEKASVATVPVTEFMSKNVVTVSNDTKIYAAVKILSNKKISGAPVVDPQSRLVGIITEYDLLIQAATRDVSEPIDYTQEVRSLGPNSTLHDAIIALYQTRFRRFPVADHNGRILGIISRIDVLDKLMGLKN